MRENGQDIKGRLDSISQVYAQRRTPVSRTHLFGIWVNVPKRRPVLMDSANVGLLFGT